MTEDIEQLLKEETAAADHRNAEGKRASVAPLRLKRKYNAWS